MDTDQAYYFSEDKYDIFPCCYSTKLKYLKRYSAHELEKVMGELEDTFNLHLSLAWLSKSTFGNVFVDFVPERFGPSILGAHQKLFDLVKHEVKYLILSESISRNFIRKKVDDYEVLVINVPAYKEFIKSFRDSEKRIRLFLFKLRRDEERIIKNWIRVKPSHIRKKEHIDEEELLDYLAHMNIDTVEKFKFFVGRLDKSVENTISTNLPKFQLILDEFRKKIADDSVPEREISKFLHKNIWLFNFRYQHLDKCETEYKTSVGNIDVYTSREQYGVQTDVLLELKAPKREITKEYRGKPAFRAVVGNAISQIIHYMESQKESYKRVQGYLLLGRSKEGFIEILNDYLSNIEVLTYEEIADRCQEILNAFEKSSHKKPVKEI